MAEFVMKRPQLAQNRVPRGQTAADWIPPTIKFLLSHTAIVPPKIGKLWQKMPIFAAQSDEP